MRPGVRVGVDVGSVRIGVAISDPDALLATPVASLPASGGDDGDDGDQHSHHDELPGAR